MKKNSKEISKGFSWSGWIKSANQSAFPMGHHVIAMETGQYWDVTPKGRKIKCKCRNAPR